MTPEQIVQHAKLDKEFQIACERIKPYLKMVHTGTNGTWHDDPKYADNFQISFEGTEVNWWGYDFEGDHRCGEFGVELLTYSNEELEKWAKNEIRRIKAERKAEKEKRRKISEAEKEQKERAELARLKAKYENNDKNTSGNEQRN